jgi:hypothetical protein
MQAANQIRKRLLDYCTQPEVRMPARASAASAGLDPRPGPPAGNQELIRAKGTDPGSS